MADSPEEMARHKRAYWAVFIALCIFTMTTVIVTWFNFGEPGIGPADISIGLVIATVKSLLVALIFMHLNHEKGLIYKFLVFTFCFALGLMALSLFALWNPIEPAFDVGGATEGATTADVGHSHD